MDKNIEDTIIYVDDINEEDCEENILTISNNVSDLDENAKTTDAATFKKLRSELAGSEDRISPIKAIRMKCIDCCCGQKGEVNLCPCKDCPLWPFRFGKNPYSNKAFSEEQKIAMAERMRNHRENKAIK